MENEIADSLSRTFSSSVEWELTQRIFDAVISEWGQPDMDLFASRHNAKVNNYCSWLPDSYCSKVDAFSFAEGLYSRNRSITSAYISLSGDTGTMWCYKCS